jgi:hypothetical protein
LPRTTRSLVLGIVDSEASAIEHELVEGAIRKVEHVAATHLEKLLKPALVSVRQISHSSRPS